MKHTDIDILLSLVGPAFISGIPRRARIAARFDISLNEVESLYSEPYFDKLVIGCDSKKESGLTYLGKDVLGRMILNGSSSIG